MRCAGEEENGEVTEFDLEKHPPFPVVKSKERFITPSKVREVNTATNCYPRVVRKTVLVAECCGGRGGKTDRAVEEWGLVFDQ